MRYKTVMSTDTSDLADRRHCRDELLAVAARLVDVAGNVEAKDIFQLVRGKLAMRLPTGDGEVHYFDLPSGTDTSRAVYLALVTSRDGWTLGRHSSGFSFAQPAYGTSLVGAYYRSTATIYLPMDWPISLTWLALTLVHEFVHAYDAAGRGKQAMSGWRGELHARQIEASMLPAAFGPRLSRLVNGRRLQAVVSEALNAGQPLGLWQPTASHISEPALDSVIGRARSRYEAHYRRIAIGRAIIQKHIAENELEPSVLRLAVTSSVRQ